MGETGWHLLLIAHCIMYIQIGQAAADCFEAFECENKTLMENNNSINCYGSHSCLESTLTAPEVDCQGSYSCYKANSIVTANLGCSGLLSCAYVNEIDMLGDGYTYVYCAAEASCMGSTMTKSSFSLFYLACVGDQSCANCNISNPRFVELSGRRSGENSTFFSGGSQTWWFYGEEAGKGATIICPDGNTCRIECDNNACTGLTLQCQTNNSCNFDVSCETSEKNDICPDGYDFSPFNITVPASPQIVRYTYEMYNSSSDVCYNTNAINCDDFGQECWNINNYNDSLIKNNGAICCTAYQSCENASSIRSLSNIEGVAIGCDGFKSCGRITGDMIALNGGNIYMAGANYDTEGGVIETTSDYSIVCSGDRSCSGPSSGDGKIFKNAANLLCTGAYTCENAVLISNISNVYSCSLAAIWYSQMNNILDSVHCVAFQACYETSISNVGNNVYGMGYQAIAFGEIINVTNLYCGGDYMCCWGCRVQSVNNIIVDGDYSLSYATIISELEQKKDRTMFVAVEGTMYEPWEIYCNETDKCFIDCRSSDACIELNLYCGVNPSRCYVNCNETAGINCPVTDFNESINIYNDWLPTMNPTQMPSVIPTVPTQLPTELPSLPTTMASEIPTEIPTTIPTAIPLILIEPTNNDDSDDNNDNNNNIFDGLGMDIMTLVLGGICGVALTLLMIGIIKLCMHCNCCCSNRKRKLKEEKKSPLQFNSNSNININESQLESEKKIKSDQTDATIELNNNNNKIDSDNNYNVEMAGLANQLQVAKIAIRKMNSNSMETNGHDDKDNDNKNKDDLENDDHENEDLYQLEGEAATNRDCEIAIKKNMVNIKIGIDNENGINVGKKSGGKTRWTRRTGSRGRHHVSVGDSSPSPRGHGKSTQTPFAE